jgi:hypothetical protein
MDDITQQMNAVPLSGNANKSDAAGNFSAGLYKYLLFVATNAGTEIIWSEADKDLKAWMKQQNQKLQSTQTSDRVKVLNHVNFPWRMPQEAKWNMHYEELVKFHTANGHSNVPWDFSRLGKWVNNQRQSKKNCKLSSNRI